MFEASRRNLLKTATLTPLGSLAASVGLGSLLASQTAAAAITPVKRVGGPSIKFSCNAYSFARMLGGQAKGKGSFSLFDLADFCAKVNFDAFDATGYYFPGYEKDGVGVPTDQYIYELKRHAFNLGLGISGTGVGNNFTTADKAGRARDVQRIKAWVEVAHKLGAPVLRVFADTQMRAETWQSVSKGATRDQVEEWIANDIRECANHAAKFGVFIGVQNHGDFLKTADDQISLIKRVDSPWCGAIVDTGYYRAPDPYAEMVKAAPYAVNWQIKQSPNGVENEKTHPIDIKRLMKIVLDSGYRGYLPIETLSQRGGSEPYEPLKLVPAFLQELRAELARQTA
ncbi:sugar phosphate isomerase/epimerase [Roseateles sp.]|uniref:sugar phosphate isomerase/epimerase family protein n=1 Tax=Roseateles sp. TaxID=1971397 RepID=UPI0025CD100C|nr:sugar phosphate isomerase/epimerase family protein [Roseateles sp.]MBV8037230.1 sugar phosphate isomerase/epimerase [Roseateles sp.]